MRGIETLQENVSFEYAVEPGMNDLLVMLLPGADYGFCYDECKRINNVRVQARGASISNVERRRVWESPFVSCMVDGEGDVKQVSRRIAQGGIAFEPQLMLFGEEYVFHVAGLSHRQCLSALQL